MQAAGITPDFEIAIQIALANESTTQLSVIQRYADRLLPLTVIDTRRIISCLRENSRLHTLFIFGYRLHDTAALNVFRNGIPLCTAVTTVKLVNTKLGNEGLERIVPAFYNTSVTSLDLKKNRIQGQKGGELIRDLIVGNIILLNLILNANHLGQQGAIGLGKGFAVNNRLQHLELWFCNIGSKDLARLLLSMGDIKNHSLKVLNLGMNNITGAEGGRQVNLLLQRFPALNRFNLESNHLGPLGARALAPVLTSPNLVLESLSLRGCNLGNQGAANLIPDGEVNRSLTFMDLRYNKIQHRVGGENALALASRCTNLDRLNVEESILSPDQRDRLNLLLD